MKHPITYKDTPLSSGVKYPVPMADEVAGFTVGDLLGLLMHPSIYASTPFMITGDGSYQDFWPLYFTIDHETLVFCS